MTSTYFNNYDQNIILKPNNRFNQTNKHIFVPKNSTYIGGKVNKVFNGEVNYLNIKIK